LLVFSWSTRNSQNPIFLEFRSFLKYILVNEQEHGLGSWRKPVGERC
jgi:hypothetical protein